ncbi:hypothetical protein [Algoriphagus vanfongensis]|nr:hypothetical protein [Algoriphagus vanfongensis]
METGSWRLGGREVGKLEVGCRMSYWIKVQLLEKQHRMLEVGKLEAI